MSDNPYAPPTSRVDDTVSPQVHATRPAQIVLAIRLAAVNYVLGMVALLLSWGYFSNLQSTGSLIVNQLFSLALLVWIYYKIYVGRNWARITLLVFSVLGGLMTLTSMVRDFLMAAPVTAKVQMIVGLLVNLVILWLLFLSPGRQWFRRASAGPVA